MTAIVLDEVIRAVVIVQLLPGTQFFRPRGQQLDLIEKQSLAEENAMRVHLGATPENTCSP